MKNFLLAFVVFLFWSVLGMWYYGSVVKGFSLDQVLWSSSKNTELLEAKKESNAKVLAERLKDSIAIAVKKAEDFAIAETTRINSLFSSREFMALNYHKGDTVFYYQNPLTIYKGQTKIYVPEYNRRFKDEVSTYLSKNTNTLLIIYGAYDPKGEIASTDSLGKGRAQFLKERLIRRGVNPDRVEVLGVQQILKFDSRGRNYGGIAMEFKELLNQPIAVVEQGVTHKILFSAFAQETFRPDATLRNYADELIAFLAKHPSKTVEVLGHTDTIGDDEDNKWIGQQRANSVRDYLISKGVDGTRIVAKSKGENQPIVSNTSEANRAKNRRIEIKVN